MNALVIHRATSLDEGGFREVSESWCDAEKNAFDSDHSHVCLVRDGSQLPQEDLDRLLGLNKPVVLQVPKSAGVKEGLADFGSLVDKNPKWTVLLVDRSVLERASFQLSYQGDFLPPDRMWFKHLLRLRVPVWFVVE